MQKWEYCAITNIFSESTQQGSLVGGIFPAKPRTAEYRSCLVKFTNEKQTIWISFEDANHLAQTIAWLGLQGWEMIGTGNTSEMGHIIYFKRPLEDETASP